MAIAVERIAFIGRDSQKAQDFVASVGFTNGGILPNGSSRETLLFIANKHQSLATNPEADGQVNPLFFCY